MSPLLLQLFRDLALELQHFARPLVDAVGNPMALYRLLGTLGWDVERLVGADFSKLAEQVGDLQGKLAKVAAAMAKPDDAEAVQHAREAFHEALEGLQDLYRTVADLDPAATLDAVEAKNAMLFAKDLANHLVLQYVSRRTPRVRAISQLLGMIQLRRPDVLKASSAPGAAAVRLPVLRPQMDWLALLSPTGNPLLGLLSNVDLRGVRSPQDLIDRFGQRVGSLLEELAASFGDGGVDGLEVHLDHAGLRLSGGSWLPRPKSAADTVVIELGASFAPKLTIDPDAWSIAWSDAVANADGELVLLDQSWIRLALIGAPPSGDPANATGTAAAPPGIRIAEDASGLFVEAVGGVAVRFPMDLLTDEQGDAIEGLVRARARASMSGKAELHLDEFRLPTKLHLGGLKGIVIAGEIQVAGLSWPAADGLSKFAATIAGTIDFPGGSHVEIDIDFSDRGLDLTSSGNLELGGGMRIQPVLEDPADAKSQLPILTAQWRRGEHLTFEVAGALAVPFESEDVAVRHVEVHGSMRLEDTPDGWVLREFSASGKLPDGWRLPGKFALTEGKVVVNYSGDEQAFAASLAGKLQIGEGETAVVVGLDADLKFPNIHDPTEIEIDVEGGLENGLQVADFLTVSTAEFDVSVRTKPVPATSIQLDATLDIGASISEESAQLSFGLFAHVFGGKLELKVDTEAQLARATITEGKAGLLKRSGVAVDAVPALEHYELTVEDFAAALGWSAGNASLEITDGTVTMQGPRFQRDGNPPTAEFGEPHKIKLEWQPGDGSPTGSFEGSVGIADFALALPWPAAESAPAFEIATATLAFDGSTVSIADTSGEIRLPLPGREQPVVFAFDGVAWAANGLPVGDFDLSQPEPFSLGNGFELFLGGVDDEQAPNHGVRALGFDLKKPTEDTWAASFSLGVVLVIPTEILGLEGDSASVDFDAIRLTGEGLLTYTTGPGGGLTASGVGCAFAGGVRARFGDGAGGMGLRLDKVDLKARNLERLFLPPDPEAEPFAIQLSGRIGFSGADDDNAAFIELVDAVFLFGPKGVQFTLGGAKASPGPLMTGLPIRLTEAGLSFKQNMKGAQALPLDKLFAPSNLTFELSAALSLGAGMGTPGATGSDAGGDGAGGDGESGDSGEDGGGVSFGGRVDGLEVSLGPGGLPQVHFDGAGVMVEDLLVFPTPPIRASGGLYFGGFRQPLDPAELFLVGKLGGSFNGMGASVTMALKPFRMAPPPWGGVGFEVQLGPAGIAIAYGFSFNGLKGGLSFANSNGDPTKLGTYIAMQEVAVDDAEVPVPEGHDADTVWVPGSNEPPQLPEVASDEPSGRGMGTARPAHEGIDRPSCPVKCPPDTMNLLCQPHPDPEAYPNRAILKFSSIDKAFLDGIQIPHGRGTVALPDWLRAQAGGAATAATQLATKILDAVVTPLREILPPLDLAALTNLAPPGFDNGAVHGILSDPVGWIRTQLEPMLVDVVESATGDLYDAVAELLYRGLPCPDVTLQLEGTFSYIGLNAFLTLTGGANISTAGSMGIMGSINLCGMPIGQARVFTTLTDAEGNPNLFPGFCGDVRVELGPVYLGHMAAEFRCEGLDVTAIGPLLVKTGELVSTVGSEVWSDLLVPLLERSGLDDMPRLAVADFSSWIQHPDRSAVEVGNALLAFVGAAPQLLASPEPWSQSEARTILKEIVLTLYDAIDPQLVCCGSVQPKIFGLPLGTELVSASLWLDKQSLGATMSFSLSRLLGMAVGFGPLFPSFDRCLYGYRVALPEPVEMVTELALGQWSTDPAEAAKQQGEWLLQGFNRLLRESFHVLSFTFAPFGFPCTSGAGRLLMPKLPLAVRGRRTRPAWQQRRAGSAPLPNPAELLVACARAGDDGNPKLADIDWDGDLGGVPVGDRFRAPVGLNLRDDYFPQGGVVGAARLDLPRILVASVNARVDPNTPSPAELVAKILAPGDAISRLGAAMTLMTSYIAKPENVGWLAFYLPGPKMPAMPRSASAQDIFASLLDSAKPPEGAFLRGEIDGRLLGIDLAKATVEVLPATDDRDGRMLFRAELPPGSWLQDFVRKASVGLEVTQPAAVPVDVMFGALAEAIETVVAGSPLDPAAVRSKAAAIAKAQGDGLGLAGAAASDRFAGLAFDPGDLLEDGGQEGASPLDTFAKHTRSFVQDLSKGRTGPAMTRLVDLFARHMPKCRLEIEVDSFGLPRSLPRELRKLFAFEGSVSVQAFSPFYERGRGAGRDLATRVRRQGGVLVVASNVTVNLGVLGKAKLAKAEFAIGPSPTAGGLPYLAGSLQLGNVVSGVMTLSGARIDFDTHGKGGLQIDVRAKASAIKFAALELRPVSGSAIRVAADLVKGDLTVSPTKLTMNGLATRSDVRFHGARPSEPLTISLSKPWSAGVDIRRLEVVNPFAPNQVFLRAPRGQLTVKGNGLRSFAFEVAEFGGATLGDLLPHRFQGAPGKLAVDTANGIRYQGSHDLELFGAKIAGRLKVCSGPAGTAVDLSNGSLRVPLLGIHLRQVNFSLAPNRLDASLNVGSSSKFGKQGWLQTSGGTWSLQARFGRSHSLKIESKTKTRPVAFGVKLPQMESVHFALDRAGCRFSAVNARGDDWVLVPDLLRIGLKGVSAKISATETSVSVKGRVRALRVGSSVWKVDAGDRTIRLGTRLDAAVIASSAQLNFLPRDSGFLRRDAAELRLTRARNGTFGLKLKARLHLYGQRGPLFEASLKSVGSGSRRALEFETSWSGFGLKTGFLNLEPGGKTRAKVQLGSTGLNVGVDIPKGTVTSSLRGWPSRGVPFPALSFSNKPASKCAEKKGSKGRSKQSLKVPHGPKPLFKFAVEQPKLTVKVSSKGELSAAVRAGKLALTLYCPLNPRPPLVPAKVGWKLSSPSASLQRRKVGSKWELHVKVKVKGPGSRNPIKPLLNLAKLPSSIYLRLDSMF